ncbi:MAG TPA: class I SAM-dependent methyltransferase [Actinomycetota bacterium]|nr:class I SAM-dependent methyltransferase [Actinomycetota bacterium]
MTGNAKESMRTYWDEAARTNAAWYVDTSLSFDSPDLQQFFETGRTVARAAIEEASVQPAGRGLAVEIGSGLGRICKALAERFDRVIGLDISAEMVKRAKELVPDEKISFEVSSGTDLRPLADGAADLVLTFTVFQHIPDVAVIEGYVREAGRVLKPGGVFVFQWNNTPGARRWAFKRSLLGFLQRTGLRAERHRRNAPEFLGSRVPLSRMREALVSAGMELRETKGLDTLYAWAWAVKR